MLSTSTEMEWIIVLDNLRQKWNKHRTEKREITEQRNLTRANTRRWAVYFSGIR